MAGPGKGRYTTYVAPNSTKVTRLRSLFNAKAPADQATFYGSVDTSDNSAAASAASARANSVVYAGVGDLSMFPQGVDMSYGESPNINDVKWNKAGDPANPYVPDLSSPGPTGGDAVNVDPLTKDEDPGISAEAVKPNYVPGTPPSFGTTTGTGTASPASTAPAIGVSPIGRDLTPGKSSV